MTITIKGGAEHIQTKPSRQKSKLKLKKNYSRIHASIGAHGKRPIIPTEARPISFRKTKVFQLQLNDF